VRVRSLQREQWVSRPPERLFPFFARPENLALVTPRSLDFRLLTPQPVSMAAGRVIDYTIRLLGIPLRWRTIITCYEPPWRFVDEQLSGPYSFWHHTHRFREQDGGTLLTDEVRYALPSLLAGPAGGLVHALYVRPRLERIFDHRARVFARLFGGRAEPAAPGGNTEPTAGEGMA
jgi:hypothetical protein